MYFQQIADIAMKNGFSLVEGVTRFNGEVVTIYERGRLGLVLNEAQREVCLYIKGKDIPLRVTTRVDRDERKDVSEILNPGMERMTTMCNRFAEKSSRLLSERIPDYKSFLYLTIERLQNTNSIYWNSKAKLSKKGDHDMMTCDLFWAIGNWNWGFKLECEDSRLLSYEVFLNGTSIGYTDVSIIRKGLTPVYQTPRGEFSRALAQIDSELKDTFSDIDFTWRI